MSTASAVLRLARIKFIVSIILGTYVYRFGGIETLSFLNFSIVLLVPMSTASAVLRRARAQQEPVSYLGTYVYRFGGIETFNIQCWSVRFQGYLCLPLRRY